MAERSLQELRELIDRNLADNAEGAITEAKLREVLHDVVDSLHAAALRAADDRKPAVGLGERQKPVDPRVN